MPLVIRLLLALALIAAVAVPSLTSAPAFAEEEVLVAEGDDEGGDEGEEGDEGGDEGDEGGDEGGEE